MLLPFKKIIQFENDKNNLALESAFHQQGSESTVKLIITGKHQYHHPR